MSPVPSLILMSGCVMGMKTINSFIYSCCCFFFFPCVCSVTDTTLLSQKTGSFYPPAYLVQPLDNEVGIYIFYDGASNSCMHQDSSYLLLNK